MATPVETDANPAAGVEARTRPDQAGLPAGTEAPAAGVVAVSMDRDADSPATASAKNATTSKRRHGPTVTADRYESAVGSWVRITDNEGIEMKVKLTGVDDKKLTFEKRVSGGTMVMSLDRDEVKSMTLVLIS